MSHASHVCPTCRRPLESVLDYPRIRVVAVERLPLPEALDTMSDRAAQKRLDRLRRERERGSGSPGEWPSPLPPPGRRGKRAFFDDGVNMTPEIEKACATPQVQEFLMRLAALAGQEIAPTQLQPPWEPDGVFRWAYPVPGSSLHLGLKEAEPGKAQGREQRACQVDVHCPGPNLGSAGGPTMQSLGPIVLIRYIGLLENV